MSLLVRSRPAEPVATREPRPKFSEKLMKKVEGLPEQLSADVRQVVEEAGRAIASQGGEQAKQLGLALEAAAVKISTAVDARVSESMGEVVQAIALLRAELGRQKDVPKPPSSWKANVERKDGKIVNVTFTAE